MSREEEIIEAGIEYTMRTKPNMLAGDKFLEEMRKFNRNKAFEEGAKWADNNPKEATGKELLYVANQTAKKTKKDMTIKVCEWLKDIDFDMEYWNNTDGFCKELFINDFRKAMEE